jgi:flagellar L-ring protein FlgH
MKRLVLRIVAIVWIGSGASTVLGEDLYRSGGWSALATDRRAERVGDTLTILVYESSNASNSVASGSKKRSGIDAQLQAGTNFDKSASFGFGGKYDGQGQTFRSGKMVAQLGATIDVILPNGDFRVSGLQKIKLNGEMTSIKVSGRVRKDDVSGQNSVLSSKIADAVIEYDGKGFSSRSAKPGVVTRLFQMLGML